MGAVSKPMGTERGVHPGGSPSVDCDESIINSGPYGATAARTLGPLLNFGTEFASRVLTSPIYRNRAKLAL